MCCFVLRGEDRVGAFDTRFGCIGAFIYERFRCTHFTSKSFLIVSLCIVSDLKIKSTRRIIYRYRDLLTAQG